MAPLTYRIADDLEEHPEEWLAADLERLRQLLAAYAEFARCYPEALPPSRRDGG